MVTKNDPVPALRGTGTFRPQRSKEIIALLGLPQGRTVGAAIRHLQQLHIDHGSVSREEAETALRTWAAERELSAIR
jgi:hypothetical protein